MFLAVKQSHSLTLPLVEKAFASSLTINVPDQGRKGVIAVNSYLSFK